MAKFTVSTDAYVLSPGQTLAVANDDAILMQSSLSAPPTVTIAGDISVSADGSFRPFVVSAVRIGDAGFYQTTLTIETTASIRVDATASHADAFGYNAGSWMPRVTNRGVIDVLAKADAYGIHGGTTLARDDTAVTNDGAIRAVSSEGKAYGAYMGGADGFANHGTIEASGLHASIGVYMFQWDGAFENSGVIRASDATPGEDSIAVYANTTLTRDFVNTGTLQGDYALKFSDYHGADFAFPWQLSPSIFDNRGAMIGKVDLGPLEQVLRNAGTIQGEVALGSGNDTYSGAAGSTSGMVSGGDGNDSLVGGVGFDNFQGNAGNDTEVGGGGDDWVVGGKDNDVLSGDGGADLVYGNLGADTCDGGAGDDIVRGGQDDDVVIGGDGDDFVSGDKGSDTMTGGAGADIFHTFGDAGVDRVTDFHLSEGDRVMLDPGTQYTVSQVGADTVINMTGGGQMILVGVQMSTLTPGWIFGA